MHDESVFQVVRSSGSKDQRETFEQGEAGMVFQGADGAVQGCDPAAARLLGCSSEQIIGKAPFDLLGQPVHVDGSPVLATDQPAIAALRSGKPCHNIVMGVHRRNGELIWLRVNATPLFQGNAASAYGVVTTLRPLRAETIGSETPGSAIAPPEDAPGSNQLNADLSRLKTKLDTIRQTLDHDVSAIAAQLGHQHRLHHQQLAEIEAIYATAPVGLYFVDLNFRYVRVNNLLAEINGTPGSEHIGRSFREVLPELADHVEPLFRQVIATGEPIIDLEVWGTNRAQPGIARAWLSSYYPFKVNGQVLGINGVVQEITDRKRIEQALKETETRLRHFADSDVIGIVFADIYGNVSYANDEFLRIVGYSRREFEAGHVGWAAITPSEWLSIDQQHIAEAKTRGTCTPYEKEYVRKDGNRVWVLIGYTLLGEARDEAVAFILDISDRKRGEAAARQSEQHLRALADAMPNIFWTARPDGSLDYFNQRWYDYTGMTLAEAQGWGWQSALHPDDLNLCLDRWRDSLRTGEDYLIEYRFRRACDGQYRWFLVRAFPLRNEDGQIVRWFGSNTDIHEQRLAVEARDRYAEETLRALAQEQSARKEAETANSLKDEFLAVLSHELRTPLNPILGWSRLLQTGRLSPEKTKDALATIERNATLQSQLVEDLLDMSRVIRGKLTLNQFPIGLGFVVSAALETVRLAADAKTICLNATLDPTTRSVLGDASRLQQVFWNLLSNAVKFTPEGGQIDVSLVEIGTQARVQIKDTGIGIDPQFLPHMFEYFRQEDGSTTRKFGGLGLGLAIARQIVELHGGTIRAESAGENQGATFTVEIPLVQAPPDQQGQDFPSSLRPSPLAGIRALVVDDEVDARSIIAFLLEDAGAIVRVASSAPEALDALERQETDLLISDIGMPDLDGYDLIQTVRASGSTIPAIALTAYASDGDQQRAIAAGFQQHLSKPVNPDDVIAIALELLQDSA
ncbi:PAS domain S-box protein [Myxacorys almedinensis]|uniref:Circadian input-output histidine kinase CikA n=1 Tax=Myxacorys almedinensis A TaxID=2690445 RepID=A0A8J7Z5N8_9CYAN|nr:PAS domain S-box protein [Myxacorys almedinensis]NDJ18631.1 PAS domain S-box protein [Myxacorys almedinensis A]